MPSAKTQAIWLRPAHSPVTDARCRDIGRNTAPKSLKIDLDVLIATAPTTGQASSTDAPTKTAAQAGTKRRIRRDLDARPAANMDMLPPTANPLAARGLLKVETTQGTPAGTGREMALATEVVAGSYTARK